MGLVIRLTMCLKFVCLSRHCNQNLLWQQSKVCGSTEILSILEYYLLRMHVFQLFLLLPAIVLGLGTSQNSVGRFSSTNLSMRSSTQYPSAPHVRQRTMKLPERIIVGYANWNECDEKLVEAVKQGVNVLMWFSINLAVDPDTGKSTITNGPDMDCVADIVKKIADLGLETIHIISIGGWNAPHPDTSHSAVETYLNWDHWNRHIAARPEKGFYGFDGFDWDIEGNDDQNSQWNEFTVECLDVMGRFSQLAKEHGNYIVSMAPAESYLDPTYPTFNRSLLHSYPEWEATVPGFDYHGRNTYAYLLDKYGSYDCELAHQMKMQHAQTPHAKLVTASSLSSIDAADTVEAEEEVAHAVLKETTSAEGADDVGTGDTFDFVTIQLYEGYSHAEYNISQLRTPPAEYLVSYAQQIQQGWDIDYRVDPALNYPYVHHMAVKRSQLVIGLANGWAGDGKFLLIYPEEVERAYEKLLQMDAAPRGFGFWNILDEGMASSRRPEEPVWMAAGLNRFLKTRPVPPPPPPAASAAGDAAKKGST